MESGSGKPTIRGLHSKLIKLHANYQTTRNMHALVLRPARFTMTTVAGHARHTYPPTYQAALEGRLDRLVQPEVVRHLKRQRLLRVRVRNCRGHAAAAAAAAASIAAASIAAASIAAASIAAASIAAAAATG